MKFINKHFVSRKYYEGTCAYYQKALTRLTKENKLYETKLNKITESMSLLKATLNDYDILETTYKITDAVCDLRTFAYKLGRILDDHEMF